MPGLDHIRTQSLFGLSDVKCYFDWNTKYGDARQEVINRLQFVQLPPGNQATISPWNAIGEVYRYTLEGKGYSPERAEGGGGLDPRAAVQAGPRRHRRDELRRRDQAVPDRRRPVPPARPRRHAAAARPGGSEREPERRRAAAHDGRAVVRRPRHRPARRRGRARQRDPRHRGHRHHRAEGRPGPRPRRGRGRDRPRAPARDGRQGRSERRGAGHRAHALRRGDARPRSRGSTSASSTSRRPMSSPRGWRSSRTTTAGISWASRCTR